MRRLLAPLARLPNARLIVALTALAGLSEGLGLAIFVPLTAVMTGEASGLPAPFSRIMPVLRALGIDDSPGVLLAVAVVLVLVSFLLIFVQKSVISRSQQRFAYELRRGLITALLESRWSTLARQTSGEVLSNLIQAAEQAGDGMHHYGLFVGGLVLLALYGALSALISWQLLVLSVIAGAVLLYATKPLLRNAARLGRKMNEADRNYTIHAVDRVRGAKLIKVTAAEKAVTDMIVADGETVSHAKTMAQVNSHILNFILQAGPVVLVAAAIAVGALVLRMPASLLLVFLLVMMRIAPRVANTQLMLQSFMVTLPALEHVDARIAELAAMREDSGEGGKSFARLARSIALERVSYRFETDGSAAVHNVSVSIGRNEMVAFVGPSGAGKSTLMELVIGIRTPSEGRVTIDDVDLRELNRHTLRRRVGYVTQDNILFNDTIRANLLFAHPTASAAEIERALEIAHVKELVAGLPDGLDTVVGEGGVRFSGGERQRIALARALVGQPEILLLDEATSSLDNESELLIQRAIESIAHTTTIIIIAHRLSTVRRADVIHVMDGGRIVESGRYDDLVARGGRFSALYGAQFA